MECKDLCRHARPCFKEEGYTYIYVSGLDDSGWVKQKIETDSFHNKPIDENVKVRYLKDMWTLDLRDKLRDKNGNL